MCSLFEVILEWSEEQFHNTRRVAGWIARGIARSQDSWFTLTAVTHNNLHVLDLLLRPGAAIDVGECLRRVHEDPLLRGSFIDTRLQSLDDRDTI